MTVSNITVLSLLYNNGYLTNTFNVFKNFKQIRNLPIGALKECNVRLYQEMNIKWSHQQVKVRGIIISNDGPMLHPLVEKPSLTLNKCSKELNIDYDEDCFRNSIAKL